MEIADYDRERDAAAVQRIWREVGWVDAERSALVARKFDCGHAVVFRIDGEAECAVHTTPGTMRHGREDLELAAVTAVTTSRVARKLGAAGRLTARSLAARAVAGAEVSALGMFEQGFYDRVGFGSGSYEHRFVFDPATLTVDRPFRPPQRLVAGDWAKVHACMLRRRRGHGGCNLTPPEIAECELGWTDDAFGLGYHDAADGGLSHFIWGEAPGEHGPYEITWLAYETVDQLFELLALIRSLGDQVSSIAMTEPQDIQLQDLLKQPFRHRRNSAGGKFANHHETLAFWQLRILDLGKCLAKTRLPGPDLHFNLALTDPVVEHLDGANEWPGAGGDFVVTLGEASHAEPGSTRSLPTLRASVGPFSRLWFGVRSASVLAATTDLTGDAGLLDALEEKVRLPVPRLGWDF